MKRTTRLLPILLAVIMVVAVVVAACAKTASVSFSAGEGTGTVPESMTVTVGEEITLPQASGLSKANHTFAGWKLGETTYQPGDKYTVQGDVTFTAQWKAVPAGHVCQHVCDVCHKCKDETCQESECLPKCPGNHTQTELDTRTYFLSGTINGWGTDGYVFTKVEEHSYKLEGVTLTAGEQIKLRFNAEKWNEGSTQYSYGAYFFPTNVFEESTAWDGDAIVKAGADGIYNITLTTKGALTATTERGADQIVSFTFTRVGDIAAEPFTTVAFDGAIGTKGATANGIQAILFTATENAQVAGIYNALLVTSFEGAPTQLGYSIAQDGTLAFVNTQGQSVGSGTIDGIELSVSLTIAEQPYTFKADMYGVTLKINEEPTKELCVGVGTPLSALMYAYLSDVEAEPTITIDGQQMPSAEEAANATMPAKAIEIVITYPEFEPTTDTIDDLVGTWVGSITINGSTYSKLKITRNDIKIYRDEDSTWIEWTLFDTDATGRYFVIVFQKPNPGKYSGTITLVDGELVIAMDDPEVSQGATFVKGSDDEEQVTPMPEGADGTYVNAAGTPEIETLFNFTKIVLDGNVAKIYEGDRAEVTVTFEKGGNVGTGIWYEGRNVSYTVTLTVNADGTITAVFDFGGPHEYTFTKETNTPGGDQETKYSVTYYKGTGNFTGTDPDVVEYAEGATVTLIECPWTKIGYTFKSWTVQVKDDDIWVTYQGLTNQQPGATFEMPAEEVRILAVWEENVIMVTITYHYNLDSDQTTVVKSKKYGTNYPLELLASLNFAIPEGREFMGWATTAGGNPVLQERDYIWAADWDKYVTKGDTYTIDLYAIWSAGQLPPPEPAINAYIGVWTGTEGTVVISATGADAYSETVGSIIYKNEYVLLWEGSECLYGFNAHGDFIMVAIDGDTITVSVEVAISEEDYAEAVEYEFSNRADIVNQTASHFAGAWKRSTGAIYTVTETGEATSSVSGASASIKIIDQYLILFVSSSGFNETFVLTREGNTLKGARTIDGKAPEAITLEKYVSAEEDLANATQFYGNVSQSIGGGDTLVVTKIKVRIDGIAAYAEFVYTVNGAPLTSQVRLTSLDVAQYVDATKPQYLYELNLGLGNSTSVKLRLAVFADKLTLGNESAVAGELTTTEPSEPNPDETEKVYNFEGETLTLRSNGTASIDYGDGEDPVEGTYTLDDSIVTFTIDFGDGDVWTMYFEINESDKTFIYLNQLVAYEFTTADGNATLTFDGKDGATLDGNHGTYAIVNDGAKIDITFGGVKSTLELIFDVDYAISSIKGTVTIGDKQYVFGETEGPGTGGGGDIPTYTLIKDFADIEFGYASISDAGDNYLTANNSNNFFKIKITWNSNFTAFRATLYYNSTTWTVTLKDEADSNNMNNQEATLAPMTAHSSNQSVLITFSQDAQGKRIVTLKNKTTGKSVTWSEIVND